MKKTIYAIFLMAAMLIANGCNDRFMDEPIASEHARDNSIIPLESALKSVESLHKRIYHTPETRSARKVKSVSYYDGNHATRSDENNPLYYVINYENDEGFAVVGARKGLEGVYAISDSGELSISDTTDNPGLAIFFDLLPTTPRPTSGYPDYEGPDSTLITKPFEPVVYIDKSDSVPPLLPRAIRSWDQNPPYNNDCPLINDVHALAGCAPVALGILMSAYEVPKSYKGHTYNWNIMKGNWSDQAVRLYGTARLIADLGSSDNLHTKYGTRNSPSDTKKYYKQTFQNFGYNTPSDFQEYSNYFVCNTIKTTNKPVLLRGKNTYSGSGHIWVCDGYYNQRIESYWGTIGAGYLLHMVWGWGKRGNGYFKVSNKISYYPGYYLTDEENAWNEDYLNNTQYIEMEYLGGITPK